MLSAFALAIVAVWWITRDTETTDCVDDIVMLGMPEVDYEVEYDDEEWEPLSTSWSMPRQLRDRAKEIATQRGVAETDIVVRPHTNWLNSL